MFEYVLNRAIVNLRRRRGLSQKAAALRADVDPKSWSKWETGDRRPSDQQCQSICRGVGCTVIELWEERTRLEEAHYRHLAAAQGLAPPARDSASPVLREMESLMKVEVESLPAPLGDAVAAARSAALTVASAFEPLADQLRRLNHVLRNPSIRRPAATRY